MSVSKTEVDEEEALLAASDLSAAEDVTFTIVADVEEATAILKRVVGNHTANNGTPIIILHDLFVHCTSYHVQFS